MSEQTTLSMPIMGQFVIPRLILNIFDLYTKFGDSSFSHSGDTISGAEFENGSCDSDYAPFGAICHP